MPRTAWHRTGAVLSERGYRVTGFDRTQVDISDSAQVEQVFAREDPAIVINAAAYNQVDVAEKEPAPAMLANGLAVRNLAMCCRQHDARFVHFSTDYVFDGTAGRAYTEEDATASTRSVRGLEAGRRAVRAGLPGSSADHSHLGRLWPGRIEDRARKFHRADAAAGGQRPARFVWWTIIVASPTYAPLAGRARSADLLDRGLTGVFHIGGGQAISWFDYASMIFRIAGVHPELKPTNEREFRTAARRPKYSALSNAKMERCGIEPFPPLETAVRLYMEARAHATMTSGG